MISTRNLALQDAVMKLRTANHLTMLRTNHLLKQYGLTTQQALILQYLSLHHMEHINQKKLELYLGISNPSVSSLMKTMVNKHLIRRLPDRSDARSYLLCLTEKGLALQEYITRTFLQVSQELYTGLTAEEIQQFTTILDKITCNLSSVNET